MGYVSTFMSPPRNPFACCLTLTCLLWNDEYGPIFTCLHLHNFMNVRRGTCHMLHSSFCLAHVYYFHIRKEFASNQSWSVTWNKLDFVGRLARLFEEVSSLVFNTFQTVRKKQCFLSCSTVTKWIFMFSLKN